MIDLHPDLRALLDRQQILDVLTRYCRGVDRGDADMIRSVYHPDAMDDHGMFKGLGVDFAGWITDYLQGCSCLHFITNLTCDLRGDIAFTETYCLSVSDNGQGMTSTVHCRYIDRLERRDGREWKIADRQVVLDVTRVEPATERFDQVPGWNFTWGRRDSDDPSHRR